MTVDVRGSLVSDSAGDGVAGLELPGVRRMAVAARKRPRRSKSRHDHAGDQGINDLRELVILIGKFRIGHILWRSVYKAISQARTRFRIFHDDVHFPQELPIIDDEVGLAGMDIRQCERAFRWVLVDLEREANSNANAPLAGYSTPDLFR